MGRAITQLTSIILLPIYLSHLTPSDYGVLAVSQMVGPVLLALWTLGLEAPVARLYYDYPEIEREKLIGTCFTLARIASVVGLIITLFIGPIIFPRIIINAPYSPHLELVIWTTFFQTFSILPLIVMRIREEAHKYVIATILTFLITTFANIYFVVFLNKGVVGVLLSNLISSVITSIGYLFYIRKYIVFTLNWNYAKRSISYSLPMIPELTLGNLAQTADRFFLDKLVPISVVGLYSLAKQFSNVVIQVIQSLKTAYTPVGFKIWSQEVHHRERELGKISLWFIIASGLTAACVSLFAQDVIFILGRVEYLGAIPYIPIASMSSVILVIYYVLSMTFLVSDNTKPLFTIFLVYAVSQLLLCAWLIPVIGVWGALVASLIAMCLRAVFAYLFGERVNPINLPLSEMMIMLILTIIVSFAGWWNWNFTPAHIRFGVKLFLLLLYFVGLLKIFVRYNGVDLRMQIKKALTLLHSSNIR